MEFDQQPWIFDRWLSSHPQSIPVECSSTRFPNCFAISEVPSLTKGQVSLTHPEHFGLNIGMERGLWDNTDTMLLPTSSCSVQSPDIDPRSAHDATTSISTLPLDAYSVIQEQFCNAPWRRAGVLEPKDPTTGLSVLYTLLEECTGGDKGHTSRCRLCNKVFTRADRAITHLRHLDHRPFWCKGSCGTKGCRQRFHSRENLTPHVNPRMMPCPHCKHKCLRQNLKRHINKYHLGQLEN